jgi:hypothetical protein
MKVKNMRICVIGCRWFFDDIKDNKTIPFDEQIDMAGKNTGNLFIGEAVRSHLRRLYGNKIETIEHYSFPMTRAADGAEIAEKFDHIVMAASNMLNAGIDFGFLATFVETSGLPLSIFGLGAQAEHTDDIFKISKGSKRLMDYAAANFPGVGVRGSFTAAILEHNGVKNIEIMGCPTGYINAGTGFQIEVPKSVDDIKRAAVSYKRDRNKYKTDDQLKDIQIDMLKLSMDKGFDLVAQADFAETWMGHHKVIDPRKLNNMATYFGMKDKKPDLEQYVLNHVHSYFTWEEWRTLMEQMDFAFGCRFHGNMMAMNAGVPALFMLHDTRTAELCETLRLPGLTIEEIEKSGGFNFEQFLEATDYGPFNANFDAACEKFDGFFRSHFD